MLLPLDTIRFSGIFFPYTLLLAIYLIYKNSNRIFLATYLFFLTLCWGINVYYEYHHTLPSIRELYRSYYRTIQQLKEYIPTNKAIICTNNLNLPWFILPNPIAGIPYEDIKKFIRWKKCSLLIWDQKGQLHLRRIDQRRE